MSQKKLSTIIFVVFAAVLVGILYLQRTELNLSSQSVMAKEIDTMYSEQTQKFERIRKNPEGVIDLYQSHFKNGSVVIADEYIIWTNNEGNTERKNIDTSNFIFNLKEDISFNPNPSSETMSPFNSGQPTPEQFQVYDPAAFGIGFFAAIVISGDDLILDLNGHTIAQSPEHALQQRFYANIELADQPFIPSEGPHSFGEGLDPARNVAIVNGALGRASHHGVHGQLAQGILLKDLVIKDFEVAGISLHGAKDICLIDTSVEANAKNIPVLGIWSSSKFIKPYLEALPSGFGIQIQGKRITKEMLLNHLKTMTETVVNEELQGREQWKSDYPFLVNQSGEIDGNAYGIVFNPKGVAVNGFPLYNNPDSRAETVMLEHVTINSISATINEVPALSRIKDDPFSGAQIDPVGSVFQIEKFIDQDGKFSGTLESSPVQIAQALVARAIIHGYSFGHLDTSRNTIKPETIAWVEGKLKFKDLDADFILNGDSMHHVNKGVVGAKLDGITGLRVNDLQIVHIKNNTEPAKTYGSLSVYPTLTSWMEQYDAGQLAGIKGDTDTGSHKNDVRALSLASTQKADISYLDISDISTQHGEKYDVDIQHDSSDILFKNLSQNIDIFNEVEDLDRAFIHVE